jgi:hypothetical protein
MTPFSVLTPAEQRRKNLESHDLVKTGDPEAREGSAIVDGNGEVVLALCRRCRGGEAQLEDESCITRLIKIGIETEKNLPPLQRALNHARQRRSWVIGEMMLADDNLTREQALKRFEEILPDGLLLAELERLMDPYAFRDAPCILEPEFRAPDGSVRKLHYGTGRQPWDDIKEVGWAAEFAAGNALKYVRRYQAKNGGDDLAKGRWYFDQLNRLGVDGNHGNAMAHDKVEQQRVIKIMNKLESMLTPEELRLLQEGLTCR